MKQNSFVRLFVFAATMLFSAAAFSQLSSNGAFSGTIASADEMALESMKSISEKMHSHFSKNFKNATDIHIRPEAKHTQVTFKENGSTNSVQYNRKGKAQYAVRTYEADQASDELRDDVEYAFPGYRLFGVVNEVNVHAKSATLVMIENKDSWKRVRILDNQIDVYEEYQKSK
jgi:hypothetical protein